MTYRSKIKKLLDKVLAEDGAEPVKIEYPRKKEHGDYATNVAFKLADRRQMSPNKLAEEVVGQLRKVIKGSGIEWLTAVEAVGGFINFKLADEDLLERTTREILPQDKRYGEVEAGMGKKVIIEHTAVNPNKELHVGHLRNAFIGDTLARALRKCGLEVEVQNLINDLGVQVATTLLGLEELGIEQKENERFDTFASRVYTETVKCLREDENLRQRMNQLQEALEDTQSTAYAGLGDFVNKILHHQLQDMYEFGVSYDLLIKESATLEFGLWERVFQDLRAIDSFVREEGGPNAGTWVVKSESGAPQEDKILVRSNGTVTYTGKDLAYHLWKFGVTEVDFLYKEWPAHFDSQTVYITDPNGEKISHLSKPTQIINVIASEQDYPQQVVREALRRLGYETQADNYHHLSYELVALSPPAAKALGVKLERGKQIYHMSGREGVGVSPRELLAKLTAKIERTTFDRTADPKRGGRVSARDLAIGSIRYYLTKFNYRTTVVFDFEEALSLEGDTGPYLQYAHARAAGILQKAGPNLDGLLAVGLKKKLNDSTRELLVALLQLPEVMVDLQRNYDITLLTTYANQIATLFNTFYEKNPVLNAESESLKRRRLVVVAAFKQVMAEILDTLGITAPEAM